jgi:CheY-like chemotaxis protein
MASNTSNLPVLFQNEDFDTHFKIFHELMSNKVSEILLVASPYDAYILEEDGSLASKIINEYRGLNLSRPPRITQAATAAQAMEMLAQKPFHLVVAMPHLDDMDVFELGRQIKRAHPDLPVVLSGPQRQGHLPAAGGQRPLRHRPDSSGPVIRTCCWPSSRAWKTGSMWLPTPKKRWCGS